MKTFGRDSFSIDRETVDLRYVEQLADFEQTSALAYLTRYALEQLADGTKTLRQLAAELQKRIETKGWDGLTAPMCPAGWQSREFRRFLRHWIVTGDKNAGSHSAWRMCQKRMGHSKAVSGGWK